MTAAKEQLSSDYNDLKQSNDSLEDEVKKLKADNESLKASNNRLKEDLDPLGNSLSLFIFHICEHYILQNTLSELQYRFPSLSSYKMKFGS